MGDGETMRPEVTAAVVRASVERGDPLAVFQTGVSSTYPRALDPPPLTTTAYPPETDPSDAVTADPQTLDAETDGNYSHGVTSHHVDFAPGDVTSPVVPPFESGPSSALRRATAGIPEAGGTLPTAPPFDRAAWLCRVQRIDPRERRP